MSLEPETVASAQRSRRGMALAGAGGLVLGGVLGALLFSSTERGAALPEPVASAGMCGPGASVLSSASAPAAPAPPPKTPIERAASGEDEAVRALQAKPADQRTVAEIAALAHARAAHKRAEIADLKRKITLVPHIIKEDKGTLARIKELASDREVATDLLVMLTDLPGTVGTDLLYTLLKDMKEGSEGEQFIHDLLYSKEVRPKLSRPLALVLDLRKVEKCEDALAILKQLKEEGDRRAYVPMQRFYNKRGCGPKQLGDCWRCLRAPDVLKEVTVQIAKRSAP